MRKPTKQPVWLEKVSFNHPEGCSEQVCNDLSGIPLPFCCKEDFWPRQTEACQVRGGRLVCDCQTLVSHFTCLYSHSARISLAREQDFNQAHVTYSTITFDPKILKTAQPVESNSSPTIDVEQTEYEAAMSPA